MIEYIGIDLGGTNIRVGAIDENEKMVYDYKEQTFTGVDTADDLYNKIVRLIKSRLYVWERKQLSRLII